MTQITVAALQCAFSADMDANIAHVSALVREAAGKGAQVILPPELFEGEYFCRVEDEGLFATAKPGGARIEAVLDDAGARRRARRSHIPTSFFEADGPHHYNSLAMVGPDGESRRASIARATFPMGLATKRSSISAPATPVSRCGPGPACRDAGRRHLLGPMVSRDRPRDDADGRRSTVLPDRDRQRTARRPALDTASDCGGARWSGMPCQQRGAGSRRQPRSAPSTARLSTAPASLPTNAATSWPNSGRAEEGVITATLDLDACEAPPRRLRLLPRPPPRPLRPAGRRISSDGPFPRALPAPARIPPRTCPPSAAGCSGCSGEQ